MNNNTSYKFKSSNNLLNKIQDSLQYNSNNTNNNYNTNNNKKYRHKRTFNSYIENDLLNFNSKIDKIINEENININSKINSNNNNCDSFKPLLDTITLKFHNLIIDISKELIFYKEKLIENNIDCTYNNNDDNNNNSNDSIENNNNDDDNYIKNKLDLISKQELECFNSILYEFNNQFNTFQVKEESLNKEIQEKTTDIKSLNVEIEKLINNKSCLIKDIQKIMINLKEKNINNNNNNNITNTNNVNTTSNSNNNINNNNKFNINNTNTNNNSIIKDNDISDSNNNSQLISINNTNNNINFQHIDHIDYEEFYLLLNSDNREYLIRKILIENAKLKNLISSYKNDDNDISAIINQLESEINYYEKFKSYSLLKITSLEEEVCNINKGLDEIYDTVKQCEIINEYKQYIT